MNKPTVSFWDLTREKKSMDCAPPVPSASIERHVAQSVRFALEADLQGADYFNISAADTAMEHPTRGYQG
jgi:hypothetical protein